jgi:hypothetical protein
VGLVVCETCKRAFINGQDEKLCPECTARLNELYPLVRNFLRNHEKNLYTAQEVSKILGIDMRDVEGLVTLGLIDSGSSQKRPAFRKTPSSSAESSDSRGAKRKKASVYHKKRN